MSSRKPEDPVRVVGMDPGTISIDLCGIEGDSVFLDRSYFTSEVAADPGRLVEELRASGPLDLVVGPSGYGLPWLPVDALGDYEARMLLLPSQHDPADRGVIPGMRGLLEELAVSGLPLVFAPGVVQLPTVPRHRKVNRIDMGTADKLCATALGVWDQARRLEIPYAETSFIYLELGGAFTSLIRVDGGRIVDGVGGTSGPLGYLAAGALDGELAVLLPYLDKSSLGTGGLAWVAGYPDAPPEQLWAGLDQPSVARAWEAYFEGLVKSVAGLAALGDIRELLLSGRVSRQPGVREELSLRLSAFAPAHPVEGLPATAKEAAQGAALIAQDLAENREGGLVDAMRLREAAGSVLGHLYLQGAEDLRRAFGRRIDDAALRPPKGSEA